MNGVVSRERGFLELALETVSASGRREARNVSWTKEDHVTNLTTFFV